MTEGELFEMIGTNTRAAREARGWTQRELSEESGVWIANISRIEAGKAPLTIKTLLKLANALGVTVAALVAGPEVK